ncbi:DUF1579 domain-containing protein [Chitiniphilus purpureus]|uniref:DUF1579 domain-containing protein n=1 Tax=Chitiniphilus purpureus TaxID=2981137 RepID=A0ABY6DPP0_9NEIS|nr:DUF1579 domain-containing protein [Chitiniphilus sp. CD1]UXY16297.1 DUF1579 domain-containing protein [Chitiniphilus sp. CD1]
MEAVQAQQQHRWLQQLIGEWTYESEMPAQPGQPPQRAEGTERVRALGELWVVCESQGQMPGCGPVQTMMTLGYDPLQQRFVGTWVGSMMDRLWVYEGELDATQKVLVLSVDGPAFDDPNKTAHYRDIIEIKSPDHRVMTSHVQGEDGHWRQFVTMHYRRQG